MTVRLKLTVDNVSKQSESWGHLPGLRKCPAKEGRRGGVMEGLMRGKREEHVSESKWATGVTEMETTDEIR